MQFVVGADEANEVTDGVVQELRRRGHEVVLVPPMPWPDLAQRVGEDVAQGAADIILAGLTPPQRSALHVIQPFCQAAECNLRTS